MILNNSIFPVVVLYSAISSSVMSKLLDFMYTGTLSLNHSNAWLLLAAATELQVSAVIELCENFMMQRSGGKDKLEGPGCTLCPIQFHGDVGDIKIAVNDDDEDKVSSISGLPLDRETVR